MSGKGNPFYMSTFKNYLKFVKIIASYYENKGHAKKIHGHKSAKFDAPGHHKH